MNERLSPAPDTPRHVAMIMDGNGRWARKRGVPRIAGHRAGAETVRAMLEVCKDAGVHYLTLYAFSTENWSRSSDEVQGLMGLLNEMLRRRRADLHKNKVRLNVIGDVARLPESVRKTVRSVVEDTADYREGVLTLALSYGARDEITRAVRAIAEEVRSGRLGSEEITEETVSSHLDTGDMPDPDLLIRTAGECRLSNFLLWQLSYAEFWITATLWPDFSKEEFREALEAFASRERRFGGRQCSNSD